MSESRPENEPASHEQIQREFDQRTREYDPGLLAKILEGLVWAACTIAYVLILLFYWDNSLVVLAATLAYWGFASIARSLWASHATTYRDRSQTVAVQTRLIVNAVTAAGKAIGSLITHLGDNTEKLETYHRELLEQERAREKVRQATDERIANALEALEQYIHGGGPPPPPQIRGVD